MDINDKVARCRILATLVVADDDVQESELELLERAMERLELNEGEKAQVMVLLDEDEALAALDTLLPQERLAFLDELADVCWADGELDDYEVEKLRFVCSALVLDEETMQQSLTRAKRESGN